MAAVDENITWKIDELVKRKSTGREYGDECGKSYSGIESYGYFLFCGRGV